MVNLTTLEAEDLDGQANEFRLPLLHYLHTKEGAETLSMKVSQRAEAAAVARNKRQCQSIKQKDAKSSWFQQKSFKSMNFSFSLKFLKRRKEVSAKVPRAVLVGILAGSWVSP